MLTNPKVPYCYYKLVTNVIRAVEIKKLSYPGIWTDIQRLSANQNSVLEPPCKMFFEKFCTFFPQYTHI